MSQVSSSSVVHAPPGAWISSRASQIAVAVWAFQFAIFLLPAFNDFPFSRGHFMRSPSYYGVVVFIPLALACLWKPLRLAQLPIPLLTMFGFLSTLYLSAIYNFIRYSTDLAAMTYLMTMVQTCIVFTAETCMVLATRALILSGAITFDAIARVVRISIGLIVIYCSYEILAYYSNIGFFHDSLKALEPYLHAVTTLNPMEDHTTEQPGSRVRGLSMEPSYFAAVFAFAFPLLIYNCFKTRSKLDYLIALLFLVMIIIGGARTAIMSAVIGIALVAVVVALGYGRKKLVVVGSILTAGLMAVAPVLLPVQQIIIQSIDLSPTKFSNIMRLGGLVATFRLSVDNLLAGVGPGLSPYFVGAYYPDFVFKSPVADKWFDPSRQTHESFSGVARILSDGGLISFVLYLVMWFVPVYLCSRAVVRQLQRDRTVNIQALMLALMVIGQFQASITIEPTTFAGYWIALGMAVAFLAQEEQAERLRAARKLPSEVPRKCENPIAEGQGLGRKPRPPGSAALPG